MKNFFCILFLLFSLVLSAEDYNPKKQVEDIIELTKQNHEVAWPKLDLNDSPIVLTFPNQEIYAVNLKKPKKVWQKVQLSNGEAFQAKKDKWRVLQLKLHPSFKIDGENVFVFKMSPNDDSIRTFAHERFHRYQLQHFAPEQRKVASYKDHNHPENLVLMKIEDSLLKSFLQAKGTEKREILKDYLAVNEARKKIIHQDSRFWEDHQQKMEGLADYVSAKMFDGEKQILGHIHEMGEGGDFADYAIKWRHYSAGATLGFALDYLQAKDWKIKIENGGYLSEILAETLNLSSDEVNLRVSRVKSQYHFEELLEKTKAKVEGFQKQMSDLFVKYQEIKGPIVRLGHPGGVGISGGGTTDRLFSFADGTTLSIKDASFSSTTDSNWKFATDNIPFLIQNRAGFREFKIGDKCCLKIDNEDVNLDHLMKLPPGEYPFETLALEGKHFNFSSSKHRGALICEGERIAIRYF